MRKGPIVAWSILGTLAGLVVLAFVVLFTGVYDVAASRGHNAFTFWFLSTLSDRSVEVHSASVVGSPPTDSAALHDGFREYDGMCVGCHGAPGVERGPAGKGMMPKPPDLGEQSDLTDREIFWIVDHGIKLAGMPAFGATESDETMWGVVAFVKQLPSMSPAQYSEWRSTYGAEEGHEGEASHTAVGDRKP